MMIQRPFSSGSRQAPDPHDNFLEEAGFYRKHTARDSSCLFRAISEQMYDTQNHHLTIRESCVDYMRKNKLYFRNCLKQYTSEVDIDEYLDELSKPKTFGTLLELEAMAHMFARNIVLFRPLELGQWFIYKPQFNKNFQIFVSHDRHFDTVYTNSFIEDTAFCQSIVYELLYKKVFKLPDITYAVERMLHAATFEEVGSTNDGMYCRKIFLQDGREFDLDTPENTCCILNNYELCHFHNPDFPQLAEMLQNDVNRIESSYDNCKEGSSVSEFWCNPHENSIMNNPPLFYGNNVEHLNENQLIDCNARLRQLDSLLPEKFISCVRQLLYEGITPFPYKVAKALDPDMYRNIEFDSWSEMRKEQRWKNWYTGGTNLQVGVKCQVYLRKQDEYHTGYIQEMPETQNGNCVVFIEDLGEKRTVPYDCLKPLPPDQIKPWPLPYRWQKQFEKYQQQQQQNHLFGPSKLFKRFSTSSTSTKCKIMEIDSYNVIQSYQLDQTFSEKEELNYKLKQYCNLDNFTPSTLPGPIEIITMPLTIENGRTPLSSTSQNNPNKTPLSVAENLNTKTDETPSSRPSSAINQQRQQESIQHPDLIDCNYINDGNAVLENNPAIAMNGISDGSCQYPIYNYYPEPFYAYPFDNSIIHATSGGQQYYCVVPNSTNMVPHPQGSVFIQPNHQLSPSVPCPSSGAPGQIANLGYYPPPNGTSTYFSASTAVLQPIIPQPITQNSTNNRQMATTAANINYAVQKSVMESGLDLPNDVATLRFFFNLGWDYYNEQLNEEKNKGKGIEGETNGSKLAIEFQKVKVENEQEKSDANNNVLTSSNCDGNNNTPDTVNANQNQQGNNAYQTRNTKYNNRNNENNKHFTTRSFNNRKLNNFHRGGGGGGGYNRFNHPSQNARNNSINQNSRNENRNVNSNSSKGTGGMLSKNEPFQKHNASSNVNEPDSSNSQDILNNKKNKDNAGVSNQSSPNSTTSNDNNDTNQTSNTGQQTNVSQSVSSTTLTTGHISPYYTDPFNMCPNDPYSGTPYNTNGTGNGSIFMPQVLTPFGVCQTVPTLPNGTPQSYNTLPVSNGQNSNYPYLTPNQSTGTINTSHPPPPLPNTLPTTPQTGGGLSLTSATYPIQTTPHLQQGFYYPTVTAPVPAHGNGPLNGTDLSNGSSVNTGLVGNDINMMNYTPETAGGYPFLNFPIYYTPTHNNGLTPTAGGNSSSTTVVQPPNNSVNGNAYQGYWVTSAPAVHQPQVTMTTPTSNNKINYSGSSNISH